MMVEPDMASSSTSSVKRASRRRSSSGTGTSSTSTGAEKGKDKSERTYVCHAYTDHWNDPLFTGDCDEESGGKPQRRGPRGGVVTPFPERLYSMLKDADGAGFSDVVSWQPHGRCFTVHQPKKFVEEVMPKYFRQSKLTSFQRQVNLYGFRRLTAGKDRGGYYHELFLCGRPDLHRRLVRIRVKGTGFKSASSPATEPDFYTYPRCTEEGPSSSNMSPVDQSNNGDAVADIVLSADSSLLDESAWNPLEAAPKMVEASPELKPLETPKLVSLSDIHNCSSTSSANKTRSEPWKVHSSGPMTLSFFAKSIVCDSQNTLQQQQEACPVTPETNARNLVSQELNQALAMVSPIESPTNSAFPSMVSLADASSSDYEEDLLSAPLPLPSEESRMTSSFQDDDDMDIILSSKEFDVDPIVDNILIDNAEAPSDYSLDPLLLLEEVTGPVC